MKNHRQPRPPVLATGLPDTHVEFEEGLIVKSVAKWWELRGPSLTAENIHEDFVTEMFNWMTQVPEDARLVVRAARFGHQALFRYADAAMDAGKFETLPMCVREYIREHMRRGELAAGYPPRTPKITTNYGRDLAIAYCVDRILARYPAVPPYNKRKGRRSAASMVGEAFRKPPNPPLTEVTVERIHRANAGISERLAMFWFKAPGAEAEHLTP